MEVPFSPLPEPTLVVSTLTTLSRFWVVMNLTTFGATSKRLERQKSSAELKKSEVPQRLLIKIKKARQSFSKKLQKRQRASILSASSLSQMWFQKLQLLPRISTKAQTSGKSRSQVLVSQDWQQTLKSSSMELNKPQIQSIQLKLFSPSQMFKT